MVFAHSYNWGEIWMYHLGELVWVKNSTHSSKHEGWALVVGQKSTKLMDEGYMVDVVVFMHGRCKQISPESIVSFNFLNRHLAGDGNDK